MFKVPWSVISSLFAWDANYRLGQSRHLISDQQQKMLKMLKFRVLKKLYILKISFAQSTKIFLKESRFDFLFRFRLRQLVFCFLWYHTPYF